MATRFPFTARNLIVGAALVYIEGSVSVTATAAGSSLTTTAIVPISDAAKLSIGDQITVASNTETPLITGINLSTGIITHDAVSATVVNGDTVTQDWENLGATENDILANMKIDVTDQYVDQSIFPITGVRTKGDYAFRFGLVDMKMANIARAIGSPDANVVTNAGVDTLELGTNEDFRTDAYLVTGYGTNAKRRSWFIDIGASKSDMQVKHSKTNKQMINMDITSYFNDTTQSMGRVKQGSVWKYS